MLELRAAPLATTAVCQEPMSPHDLFQHTIHKRSLGASMQCAYQRILHS